jgi:predicted alpha/beta superfamily hydrolase
LASNPVILVHVGGSVRAVIRALLVGAACLLSLAAGTAEGRQPIAVATRLEIHSAVLGQERPIAVFTPRACAAVSCPVLYVTDADTQFLHTVATVDHLARNGRIPALIVVGIYQIDRSLELVPYPSLDRTTASRVPTAGGGDDFLKFIETELIPWVESHYRTAPYRVFTGHSFGGLFATHILATRPELFNALVAVSPSLTWRGGEPVRRVEEMLGTRTSLRRQFFFTIGSEGRQAQTGFDNLQRVLKAHNVEGFNWQGVKMPEEDHGSIVLRSHYQALEWIFDGWRLPVDQETGTFQGSLADLEAHYARLSKRLGWAITPPEAALNGIGYRELGRGHTDEAIRILERNVALYPESANVYDSLGEALEAAGRLADAKARYDEAIGRAERTGDPNLGLFRQHRRRAGGS